MNPATNPYTPAAGSRPPELVGRDVELAAFDVALGLAGKGAHDRSIILSGASGVGKTVLLREFNHLAREQSWITSGVLECDENEQLPWILARLCLRTLRHLERRSAARGWAARAFGVLKAFTLALSGDGQRRFDIDSGVVRGTADSGDLEMDAVELLREVGRVASMHGEGVLLLLDEMHLLSRADMHLLVRVMHRVNQEASSVLIAGAGLPQLSLMLVEDEHHVERLFEIFSIDSLGQVEAARALTVPASRENVAYSREALTYILERARGYPYCLQQWGETVWNESQCSPIGLDDALAARELVIDELDRRFYRHRYDAATEAERIYMAAMADLPPGSRTSAKIAFRMGLTVKGASMRRDGLLKKGLIYRRADTELDFAIPQFAAFVGRFHPFDATERPRRGRPPRQG